MEKTMITKADAVSEISELLGIKEWKQEAGEDKPAGELSFFVRDDDNGGASFFVDKRHIPHDDVIKKLMGYFEDREFSDDGECAVSPIVALYTVFSIQGKE